MKKIFIFIFLITTFTLKVNAEACDAYDIKRLKEIANGVEITYELQEPVEVNGYAGGELTEELTEDIEYKYYIYDQYKISITGLTDEIYIYDKTNEKKIVYSDTVNGNIEYFSENNGKIKFEISSSRCPNDLKTTKIILPFYNSFSKSKECESINYSLDICNKYVNERLTYEEFYSIYSAYFAKNNKNSNFNIKYLIIFGVIIILFVVYKIIKKQKGVLK